MLTSAYKNNVLFAIYSIVLSEGVWQLVIIRQLQLFFYYKNNDDLYGIHLYMIIQKILNFMSLLKK